MRKASYLSVAAFLLLGCEQSVDEQFEAMRQEQEVMAPELAKVAEDMYRHSDLVPDEKKREMIGIWEEYKRVKAEGERKGLYNKGKRGEE